LEERSASPALSPLLAYLVYYRGPLLVALLTFGGAFLLYLRTAAPSVLSGDSGEFQFAAPLWGVPHPTGYPLSMLLGKVASLVPTQGDIARRVTLVSAGAGAVTVALCAVVALRAGGAVLAAVIAAVVLAVAPGMWHAATIAEVYTLNTLLLVLLLALLWWWYETASASVAGTDAPRLLCAAAVVAGLGVSHHGSFTAIGAPLLLVALVAGGVYRKPRLLLAVVLCGVAGLSPWLLVLWHYARMGPFNGLDHGLSMQQGLANVTYFWGAPTSWGEAVAHITGGVMRHEGVFTAPTLAGLGRALLVLWERLWFEFGAVGMVAVAAGGVVLLRRAPALGVGSGWIAAATVVYFASLGPAVNDAMMFTLPLVLVWALWVGVGAAAAAEGAARLVRWRGARSVVLVVLLALSLVWGYSRLPYGNKAHLWLFRSFGEGALERMAPDAVVLVRWEQGTVLQYLRLVEGQRPDVWVDMVEPGDEAWLRRAERRYGGYPVYIIGNAADGAETGAQRVWETEYAGLYRLW